MQKFSVKNFIPAIVWFFIVLVLTCMPGRNIPKIGWLEQIHFDKLVHIGMFGGLTFLFCWPFSRSNVRPMQRRFYFIKIALATSIWGLDIEFIQKYFAIGRSFELLDWAADSLGSFVALLFCLKLFSGKALQK